MGERRMNTTSNALSIRLGLTIRRYRMMRGLSQQELACKVGLTAHSNISDYELGHRIPPRDLVLGFESALSIPSGELVGLHRLALEWRADSWFAESVVSLGLDLPPNLPAQSSVEDHR